MGWGGVEKAFSSSAFYTLCLVVSYSDLSQEDRLKTKVSGLPAWGKGEEQSLLGVIQQEGLA